MCVLLCASPKVRAWLDLPAALSYRQSLQICLPRPTANDADFNDQEGSSEVDELKRPRVTKRSTWAQLYVRRMAEQQAFFDSEPHTLTEDWRHDALEAIANAWGRLLAFLGLRR
jgi:hypothetical protein